VETRFEYSKKNNKAATKIAEPVDEKLTDILQ
jgi:hypothetical protein